MFVVIYEFVAKPGNEDNFIEAWYDVTRGIYEEMGSLGSRLHHTDTTGVFIAYAQWPDRKTWEAEIKFTQDTFIAARERMKNFMVSVKVLHELEVESDYLQNVQFK